MNDKNRVTNKMAREIRQDRLNGMTYRAIMMKFNVSEETARKYSSEINNQKILKYGRDRYQRIKQDPEAYAKMRERNLINQRNFWKRQKETERRNDNVSTSN